MSSILVGVTINQTLKLLASRNRQIGDGVGWWAILNCVVITPPATHSFSDGGAMVEAAMCRLGLIQMIDQLASKAAQGYFN